MIRGGIARPLTRCGCVHASYNNNRYNAKYIPLRKRIKFPFNRPASGSVRRAGVTGATSAQKRSGISGGDAAYWFRFVAVELVESNCTESGAALSVSACPSQ